MPLTRELVTDLYVECGIGINHLEMLTGQPASTVRRRLHTLGVPSRRAGGRTPFRRRWRASMSRAPSQDESDRIGKDLVGAPAAGGAASGLIAADARQGTKMEGQERDMSTMYVIGECGGRDTRKPWRRPAPEPGLDEQP